MRQSVGEPAQHLGVARPQSRGAREAFRGLRRPTRRHKGIADIEVGIGICRIAGQHLAIGGQCVVGAPEGKENCALVHERRLGLGIDLQGGLDPAQRLVQAALLQRDDGQAVQGDEMAGLERENLRIGPLRLGELSLLVKLRRLPKRLAGRQGPARWHRLTQLDRPCVDPAPCRTAGYRGQCQQLTTARRSVQARPVADRPTSPPPP